VATAGTARRLFGAVAITWQVVPGVRARSRILGCVALGPARGRLHGLWQVLLGAGDLVMMRRQLRTLKRYAEAAGKR
jgi:hypothetical protein